jgi:hypothetical protein
MINWLPIQDDERDGWGTPFLAPIGIMPQHKYVDTGLGFACDEALVDIIVTMNNAGIETLYSCQDVLEGESEYNDDVPPTACIVITWDSTPKLLRILDPYEASHQNDDGTMLKVFRWSSTECAVSFLFPLEDVDKITERIKQGEQG